MNAKKNMLFLVLAGIVLVAVNATVWGAAKHGQFAPIANVPLWAGFVVLNTLSLLWAVSLLGLQPLVVAISYMAGGFLAYQGVKLMPEANIAELTTTGATYGAFGALVIGNATTKVRLAFFHKRQIPFVFVILALLAMDAFLNSCVSNPGWNVVLNTLVFPFILAGGIIGLIWLVLVRVGIGHPVVHASLAVAADSHSQEKESAADAMQLMIKIPDHIEDDEEPEPVAVAMEMAEASSKPEAVAMVVAPEEQVAFSKNESDEHFFPLDIDKDEDFILPVADSKFMEMSDVVEEIPSPAPLEVQAYEPIQIVEEKLPEPKLEPAPIQIMEEKLTKPEPEPVLEKVAKDTERKSSDDWLSGHLDLLNQIRK